MKKVFFITGTDTGVGKTLITASLLNKFNQMGIQTAGFKPVASGSDETAEGLRNDDALSLQKYSSLNLPYSAVNPYCFAPPIAPHIAALQTNKTITIKKLCHHFEENVVSDADVIMIEGAGGWLVPLNQSETLADFAKAVASSVILVVGLRLGCINHALLSLSAIQAMGLTVSGWVINQIDPDMLNQKDNIETLKERIPAPMIGIVPYLTSATPEIVMPYLAIQQLSVL